jgi:hypothetical protein
MVENLPSLFKDATTESITSVLGEDEVVPFVTPLAETDFENPLIVIGVLFRILNENSFRKDAIVEEFRFNVHLLLEKVKFAC